jgi:peptide/nickel transport system substrate-binding protein
MLAAAGYSKGFTLTTIVETGEYATAGAEAQNLQSQLSKIGVTLKLKQLSTGPYVSAWLASDYDAAVALNGGSYDPFLMYGRYFTSGGSLSKPAGLNSSTLADLLTQGNATSDNGRRSSATSRRSSWPSRHGSGRSARTTTTWSARASTGSCHGRTSCSAR